MMEVPRLHGFGPAANCLLEAYNTLLKSQIGGPPAPIPHSTGGSTTDVPIPHVGGSSSPIPMAHVAGGSSTPMLQKLQATIEQSTPMPPITINNARGPSLDERERDSTTLAGIEPTPTVRLCELLDWNWNCIAVAKVSS